MSDRFANHTAVEQHRNDLSELLHELRGARRDIEDAQHNIAEHLGIEATEGKDALNDVIWHDASIDAFLAKWASETVTDETEASS